MTQVPAIDKPWRWKLPRPRAFERIGLGAILLSTMIVVSPLLTTDANLLAVGALGLLVAVGLFVGIAVDAKKDAFAAGLLAGLAGVWFGFLVSVPLWYVWRQAADATGTLLALGVGFSLGLVLGGLAGLVCGGAAILAQVVLKARQGDSPS